MVQEDREKKKKLTSSCSLKAARRSFSLCASACSVDSKFSSDFFLRACSSSSLRYEVFLSADYGVYRPINVLLYLAPSCYRTNDKLIEAITETNFLKVNLYIHMLANFNEQHRSFKFKLFRQQILKTAKISII